MKHFKVAGVVILYNPDDEVIDRILNYIPFLEMLVIVDNSEQQNTTLVKVLNSIPKVIYQKNETNEGVAQALNVGAKLAIAYKCDFLLTMDQDSSFVDHSFEEFLSVLENLDYTNVGIVAPAHSFTSSSSSAHHYIEEVNFTMTSGNLLNLNIYTKIGGFLEPLFIDHIDHEYGLRLNSCGYKVIQANNIVLKHNLGQLKAIRFFNLKLALYISHHALRGYYMSRNGFYVANKYKNRYWKFRMLNFKLLLKEVLKAVFLEDNRVLRIKYLWKGYKDYKMGILGKLSDQ